MQRRILDWILEQDLFPLKGLFLLVEKPVKPNEAERLVKSIVFMLIVFILTNTPWLGEMLTWKEAGRGVYGNSLGSLCNFPVNVKLFPSEIL